MKRFCKIAAWIVGGIILLAICVIGFPKLKDLLTPDFEKTKIYPDENRIAPSDTILIANGVKIKMIGIKGGQIDCRGLKKTIDLDNFYISETEVTQELWTAIMGDNPSLLDKGDSLPVENVDLVDCFKFVNKLDSVTGNYIDIPTYPEWLYVAHLGAIQPDPNSLDSTVWHKGNSENTTHKVKLKNPDRLGVYDMLGNVSEWTLSGSDPLFIVAGGSFNDEPENLNADYRGFYHGKVKTSTNGFRLVFYPTNSKK